MAARAFRSAIKRSAIKKDQSLLNFLRALSCRSVDCIRMLRSIWLSPSPRGEVSFFSMVADAFLDTIPFPLIVIFIILAAVMIRFMTAWGRSQMIPWVMHEYRKNLPYSGSD